MFFCVFVINCSYTLVFASPCPLRFYRCWQLWLKLCRRLMYIYMFNLILYVVLDCGLTTRSINMIFFGSPLFDWVCNHSPLCHPSWHCQTWLIRIPRVRLKAIKKIIQRNIEFVYYVYSWEFSIDKFSKFEYYY